MPKPNHAYTFVASPEATDYARICKENPEARVLVVKTEKVPPLTFVRMYSSEDYSLRLHGIKPTGKVEAGPIAGTWAIFDGDLHAKALPLMRTTVETYS